MNTHFSITPLNVTSKKKRERETDREKERASERKSDEKFLFEVNCSKCIEIHMTTKKMHFALYYFEMEKKIKVKQSLIMVLVHTLNSVFNMCLGTQKSALFSICLLDQISGMWIANFS